MSPLPTYPETPQLLCQKHFSGLQLSFNVDSSHSHVSFLKDSIAVSLFADNLVELDYRQKDPNICSNTEARCLVYVGWPDACLYHVRWLFNRLIVLFYTPNCFFRLRQLPAISFSINLSPWNPFLSWSPYQCSVSVAWFPRSGTSLSALLECWCLVSECAFTSGGIILLCVPKIKVVQFVGNVFRSEFQTNRLPTGQNW